MPTSAEELQFPVPIDRYTDKPLKIKATDGGVSIYSVGWNQVDDSDAAESIDDHRIDDIRVLAQEWRLRVLKTPITRIAALGHNVC